MNKKIMYTLVFTSLFIISTVAVFMQPVTAAKWSFGVPDQAKGMKLQSEIKAYDEDTWVESLGICVSDSCNYKYGGDGNDANNVGAKSQTEIQDWEKDYINFFADQLMTSDVDPECDGTPTVVAGITLTDYWSAADLVHNMFTDMGQYAGSRTYPSAEFLNYVNPKDPGHGRVGLLESAIATAMGGWAFNPATANIAWLTAGDPDTLGTNASIYATAQFATDLFAVAMPSVQDIKAFWSKTYKGVAVEADLWDFTDEAFDSDPDDEGKILPFIEDPDDLWDSYNYFVGFLNYEFAQARACIEALLALNETYTVAMGSNPVAAARIRTVLSGVINGSVFAGAVAGGFSVPLATAYSNWLVFTVFAAEGLLTNPIDTMIEAYLSAYGNQPLQAGQKGLMLVDPFFRDAAPLQKFEYLALLLKSGIPAHQSVEKWLDRLVDNFNIDEDTYWGDNGVSYSDITLAYPMITVTSPMVSYVATPFSATGVPFSDPLFQGGIKADGLTVTVEYDWVEGTPISNDNPDERSSYEIVYTYSDTGGQSVVEYYSGDDLFFKKESLAPAIPGYEVTILIGAGAISAIGLIYVIMKKRRM